MDQTDASGASGQATPAAQTPPSDAVRPGRPPRRAKAQPAQSTAAPAEATPPNAAQRKAAPIEAAPTRATPTRATPTRATPAKATARTGTAKATSPKAAPATAAPDNATARKATPAKAAPAKAAPAKGTPATATARKATSGTASRSRAVEAKANTRATEGATSAVAPDAGKADRPIDAPVSGSGHQSPPTDKPPAPAAARTRTAKAAPPNSGEAATPPARRRATPAAAATKQAPATATLATSAPAENTRAGPEIPPAQPDRVPSHPDSGQPGRVAPAVRTTPPPKSRTEQLARLAVREFGRSAQSWFDATRQRYPAAGPDAWARLAAHDFVQQARRRAAAVGAARFVGPFAAGGPLARARVEVVLAVAAAYGVDPTDPDRAAELVTVLHARKPVAAAGRLTISLAVRTVGAIALPLGGGWTAAVQARAVNDVAERARTFYRTYSPAM